ncbi:MAG TPA: (Fe-S)-binding protein [Terriglobales bacterium]|nr:(Fe-S)-binding protein [Terriglobales bacterium]
MPRVALFIPCFVDQLSPQVGIDMVQVLRRIGCETYFPSEQTCCGQPAFNSGFWDEARPVAERFVRVFENAEAVVCPSGSCTTMVRNFYRDLLADSPLREVAAALAGRVFEFSEYLVKIAGVEDVGAEFPHRVTLHESCHALRELHIQSEPRKLLSRVRGLELVELPHSEECCGFGGAFAVKFGMISAAMGDAKAANVDSTQAEYVTAVDPSCLLHLEGILRHGKHRARTIHLASILACESSREKGAAL